MSKCNAIIITGMLFLLLSCGSSAKKDILPVNSMKQVVWDMMKADEWFAKTNMKDTLAKKKREDIRLYEQVFTVHHITREQFYTSYRYYETHPESLKELLDSVEALSTREQQKLSQKRTEAVK